MKEASGEIVIYTSEKLAPQNIGIATAIVSISVSVAELIALPVWGYVSTSGMPENYIVAAYITFKSLLFSSRHQLITTSGLHPPY